MTTNDVTGDLAQAGRQLWWLLLIRGIFAVIFGIVAIVWPSITTWALVVIFGIYAIIDGVVALGRAWQTRGRFADWGWWALVGIVSIAAGIVALVWPQITALVLLYVIAFYAILFGVLELIGAFTARKIPGSAWGWRLAAGILAIILGIVLLWTPGTGILAIIWVLGWYAIFFGVLLIVLAFKLKGHARRPAAAT